MEASLLMAALDETARVLAERGQDMPQFLCLEAGGLAWWHHMASFSWPFP